MTGELPVRIFRKAGDDAFEALRVWIADANLHVCIKGDLCEDPAVFGVMLSNIARHYARASNATDDQEGPFLARIRDGFNVEIEQPRVAPEISGHVIE